MVTLPTEAAGDGELVASFAAAGMDCARINSAHDDRAAWTAMVSHVRAVAKETARRVPILVDLPGPKVRTGAIEPGPEVVRLRPRHDALGRVTAPARAWLAAEGSTNIPSDAEVLLTVEPSGWLRSRPAMRWCSPTCRASSAGSESAPGSRGTMGRDAPRRLSRQRHAADRQDGRRDTARTASCSEVVHSTRRWRHARADPGPDARQAGNANRAARIPCTLLEAFDAVSVGDRVWIDDGKFGGVTRRVAADEIELEITRHRRAAPSCARRRASTSPIRPSGSPYYEIKTSRRLRSRSRMPT